MEAAMAKQYTVGSSHGELTIDHQGFIIHSHLDNNDADGGGHLARITRFDLAEWRKHRGNPDTSDIDILDLGYWYTNPETGKADYAPPDAKWRAEVAEILLDRRVSAGNGDATTLHSFQEKALRQMADAASPTIALAAGAGKTKESQPIHKPFLRAVPPTAGTMQRTKIYGPAHKDGGDYAALCEVSEPAIARQMVAAFNAFAAVAHKLNCNDVQLAEAMPDGALLAEVLDNADLILFHTPHLDRASFDKATAVIAKVKGGSK
jgi:hypothetical protein